MLAFAAEQKAPGAITLRGLFLNFYQKSLADMKIKS